MGRRTRGAGLGLRRGRRLQASPTAGRRPGPDLRARSWLGWGAAAAGVALVAFFVGRAGSEVGVPNSAPSPSAAPLTVTFGTALDAVSGEAINVTDRFRAGDTVAYSVRLAAAAGVARILVEIIRLDGETETIAQRPSSQGIVKTSAVIAFTVRASTLLGAWGPGEYVMQMYLPDAKEVFAEGRFTLVETPAAS